MVSSISFRFESKLINNAIIIKINLNLINVQILFHYILVTLN